MPSGREHDPRNPSSVVDMHSARRFNDELRNHRNLIANSEYYTLRRANIHGMAFRNVGNRIFARLSSVAAAIKRKVDMKKFAPLAFIIFMLPGTAFAASHHYTCSDNLNYVGTAACVSTDTFSFGGSTGVVVDDITPAFKPQPNTQYYISYKVLTGSGTIQVDDENTVLFGGTAIDSSEVPLTMTGGTSDYINFGRTAGSNFNGTINEFCIDNDGYSCSGTPPPPPPPPPSPGIDCSLPLFAGLICPAETGYASTTGESLSASVAFAGDNFTKPFIGGGFAVLYNLRYWILALVILAAGIYFSYRAYRFYHH